MQFYPEVAHTQDGTKILSNFAVEICKARRHWTMDKFVDQEKELIFALVGEKGQVIRAINSRVDSTVAAKLM
jgi:GMP synthase (glutamine-hydrolysing)